MATTPPVPIDAGPALPSSSDSEATFDAAFEAFLSWQKTQLQPQTNALASNVYSNAQAAETAASTAVGARDDAADSASAANADALRLASLDALWLGAAAADPATGRGGAPLVAGNAYVNSGTGLLRTYNGTAWVNALNVTAGVASVNGSGGAVSIKTVAGQSLVGSGDVPFKTLNGNNLQGSGNIVVNSGAVDFLGEVTANGAASADITGLETLGATYDRMFIIADAVNLNASSGSEIRAFFQMGGAWANGNYEHSTETRISTASPTNAQSNTGTFIPVCLAAAGGSLSPGGFGTQIFVNIHRTTGAGGRIDWQSLGMNSSLAFNAVQGVAQRSSSTQGLQGIRFAPSTGTMFGVFRLYGIRKS